MSVIILFFFSHKICKRIGASDCTEIIDSAYRSMVWKVK